MRKRKTIFLSYRRDDNPGYVRQLQEDLQRYFGEDKVFRDVEHITGGQQWKEVLSDSLTKSVALVVVIGPRWEQIWRERVNKEDDYIVFELNKARELGIPIFPVTINGTVLSDNLNLGSISWLMDKQHYDISDRQGRWPTDVLGLVDILEREKVLVRKKQKKAPSGKKKYLLIPLAVAALAFFGYLQEVELNPIPDQAAGTPIVTSAQPVVSTPASPSQTAEPAVKSFPNIEGYWHDEENTVYEVSEVMTDGSFVVRNPYSVGVGQFLPNMPRKFSFLAEGIGHGEYSVSTDDSKMMGWFYYTDTDQTHYGTLWRTQ